MAVDSSNKKKNNNKKTNISNEKEVTPKNTKGKTIDDSDIVKEVVIKKREPNTIWLLLSLVFLLLLFTEYLLFPKINLSGKKIITLNYNDTYIEPGYRANILKANVTQNVIIDSNYISNKIGSYYINYYLKYGFITIKKERIINVIDNVPPVISEVADEIKICPKENIDDITYKVIDEYDGDITSKAKITSLENKLIIEATDGSNNHISKEIKIDRKDEEAPKITLKGYTDTYVNYGNKYVEPGYSATDNCDGDLTSKVTIIGNVGTSIGTYKLTYSVSDESGNKTEVTRNITIRNNNLYNSGSIGNGVIYLTFDDGPNNGTTNVILDILKEEGIKATFFVTCNGPDYLIKRMYDEGHTVALHTATHNYSYIYSSVDNYFEDLNRVSNRVKNITGKESKIIRFPGGSSNTISRNYQNGIMTTLTSMVLDKGYRYFDWNVDAMDASTARSSSDVYNNVTRNLSKSRSNVVLMHDIKAITRDALRNIINYAYSQGYTFSRIEMDTYMIRHSVNN